MSPIIYIEGGGDRNENLERLFRRAWTKFFAAAGLEGHLPRVVRGGSRSRTFDLFRKAAGNPSPDRVPLLLVDSEEPVQEGHSPWQHLNARDNWSPPGGAGDDQAFLMVQVMETWFLADREALRRYFGTRFRENALPQWPRLEDVSKARVFTALQGRHFSLLAPFRQGHGLISVAGGNQSRTCRDRLSARPAPVPAVENATVMFTGRPHDCAVPCIGDTTR